MRDKEGLDWTGSIISPDRQSLRWKNEEYFTQGVYHESII